MLGLGTRPKARARVRARVRARTCMRALRAAILNRKSCTCVNSGRNFWTTNLKSSVIYRAACPLLVKHSTIITSEDSLRDSKLPVTGYLRTKGQESVYGICACVIHTILYACAGYMHVLREALVSIVASYNVLLIIGMPGISILHRKIYWQCHTPFSLPVFTPVDLYPLVEHDTCTSKLFELKFG